MEILEAINIEKTIIIEKGKRQYYCLEFHFGDMIVQN